MVVEEISSVLLFLYFAQIKYIDLKILCREFGQEILLKLLHEIYYTVFAQKIVIIYILLQ
jgi:hypothetical protein